MVYRIWTSKEKEYIRNNFIRGMNTRQFAKENAKKLNKTVDQVVNKIGEMGLNRSYFISELQKDIDAEKYMDRIKRLKESIEIGSKVRVREYIDATWLADRIRAARVAGIYEYHVVVDFGKYRASYRWDELEAIL